MNHFIASTVTLAALIGCSGCSPRQQLDKTVAADALKLGLDAWQAGQKPAALRGGTPSIVFGDSDWEAGVRLRQYRILSSDRSDGTNLHADVELVLAAANQKARKVIVTYLIGTRPQVTVFRE